MREKGVCEGAFSFFEKIAFGAGQEGKGSDRKEKMEKK